MNICENKATISRNHINRSKPGPERSSRKKHTVPWYLIPYPDACYNRGAQYTWYIYGIFVAKPDKRRSASGESSHAKGAADSKNFLSSQHEELNISPEALLRRGFLAQSDQRLYALLIVLKQVLIILVTQPE